MVETHSTTATLGHWQPCAGTKSNRSTPHKMGQDRSHHRITLRNRKFLHRFIPVQKQLPRRTIVMDIRCFAKTATPGNMRTNHLPVPTPYPETMTEQVAQNPPASTIPPTTDNQLPPVKTPEPTLTPTSATQTPVKKPPLAIRRLLDYNKKGLLEH